LIIEHGEHEGHNIVRFITKVDIAWITVEDLSLIMGASGQAFTTPFLPVAVDTNYNSVAQSQLLYSNDTLDMKLVTIGIHKQTGMLSYDEKTMRFKLSQEDVNSLNDIMAAQKNNHVVH
jgi:hypothetical protein